jgi:hypothetical protein
VSKYELSIASGYVQNWTLVDAIREFFQNAYDQEVEVPGNSAFIEYQADKQTLIIGNKKSVLSAKTLLLGTSSKKDNPETIGQYGEGYKLATLVALRCGCKVTFYNYGKKEVWRPRIVKARRYEGAEVLTFFTEKYVFSKVPDNDLTIVIEGIWSSEYEEIVQSNLRLQENLETIETELGTVLLDKRLAGKIFVNGLYVRTEKDFKCGYDIPAKYLKLDRDRKMVSTFDLKWYTSKLWTQIEDEKAVEMARENTADAEYIADQSYYSVNPKVCNDAYDDFRNTHGEYAIPVETQTELEDVLENYENAKPVLVRKSYKCLVTKSMNYKINVRPKVKLTLEDKLIMWVSKVRDRLTDEEYAEFLKILGKEE